MEKRITIRLSEEDYQQLQTQANEKGGTLSDTMREAWKSRTGIDHVKTIIEESERHICGQIESLKEDIFPEPQEKSSHGADDGIVGFTCGVLVGIGAMVCLVWFCTVFLSSADTETRAVRAVPVAEPRVLHIDKDWQEEPAPEPVMRRVERTSEGGQ